MNLEYFLNLCSVFFGSLGIFTPIPLPSSSPDHVIYWWVCARWESHRSHLRWTKCSQSCDTWQDMKSRWSRLPTCTTSLKKQGSIKAAVVFGRHRSREYPKNLAKMQRSLELRHPPFLSSVIISLVLIWHAWTFIQRSQVSPSDFGMGLAFGRRLIQVFIIIQVYVSHAGSDPLCSELLDPLMDGIWFPISSL